METTCVHYSRDYVGNPCIVALDRDRLRGRRRDRATGAHRPAGAGHPGAGLRGRHGGQVRAATSARCAGSGAVGVVAVATRGAMR